MKHQLKINAAVVSLAGFLCLFRFAAAASGAAGDLDTTLGGTGDRPLPNAFIP